jgi:hypothetical protein
MFGRWSLSALSRFFGGGLMQKPRSLDLCERVLGTEERAWRGRTV